jgi:polyisoprenoid-binding protein YceI
MKTVKLVLLAAVIAISPACKKNEKKEEAKKEEMKKEEPKQEPVTPDPAGSGAAQAGSGAAMAGSGAAQAGSAAAAVPTPPPPAEDTADWIKVMATHAEKQPTDPVEVKFEKFKVVKANFDPKKIEGGTATIEIDLASLKSGDAKRDTHLATPDYLDVGKFATATVEIGNVKKKDDKNYTADAKVKLHGVEKKFPVTFEVVEAKDDWIRIKGEHTFKRLDFKVGKKPGPDKKKDDGVADEMTIKLQLTLKKT